MTSLFDNTESKKFLINCLGLLMKEADRGCVLLGVSMLDEELDKLFNLIIPKDTSNTRKKEIFDGKGAFGDLSLKLDIAYVCHILPADLVNSINRLRKLRNNLAHRPNPFEIKDNLSAIKDVFSLVEGDLPSAMVKLSGEYVVSSYSQRMMETDHPTEQGKRFCETEEEVFSYITDNENIQNILKEQRIKAMFVIGISVLASLIIYHRDKTLLRLGSEI